MKTQTYTDEAGKLKAKPRKSVEAGIYSGTTSHGGADGLGKFKDEHLPQDKQSGMIDPCSGDVPKGWLTGGSKGIGGVTDERPHFDNTTRKGNAKPEMKGGGDDGSRNHFSRTSNTKGRESDWSADYKPNKFKG